MPFIAKTQDHPVKLKYLGTAGWKITDGNLTILVDPYISRIKLGTGPGVRAEDPRETVERSDYFVSDAVEQNLFPFREDVKRLSPQTKVIIPEHLGTITID